MKKLIRINDNTKGNLCCSASIDISVGCKNHCVSCYGVKASRLGSKFFTDTPEVKTLDVDIFKKDCRKYKNKGIRHIRLGKFSDPGDNSVIGITNEILEITAHEEIQCVFVSKSLQFNEETAKLISSGNHILHISLGMITNAPSNESRLNVRRAYRNHGCNTYIRIVEDITKPMPDYLRIDTGFGYSTLRTFQENCLLTPLRFNSKEDVAIYGADLTKFKWVDGYYRPIKQEIHNSWSIFKNWCGEAWNSETNNTENYCANCLIGVENGVLKAYKTQKERLS